MLNTETLSAASSMSISHTTAMARMFVSFQGGLSYSDGKETYKGMKNSCQPPGVGMRTPPTPEAAPLQDFPAGALHDAWSPPEGANRSASGFVAFSLFHLHLGNLLRV